MGGFGGGTLGPCKPNIMVVVTWSLPHGDKAQVQLMIGENDAKSTVKAKLKAGALYMFCREDATNRLVNKHNIFDNSLMWQDECRGQGRPSPLHLRMPLGAS